MQGGVNTYGMGTLGGKLQLVAPKSVREGE